MKHQLRRLPTAARRQSYWLSRSDALLRRRLKERRHSKPPVIVHSMGKVGSTSVSDAAAMALPDRIVYQVHHLSHETITAEDRNYRQTFRDRRRINAHLVNSIHLRRLLDRSSLPTDTRIVTMVRDPMAQRFSLFFQTLEFRISGLAERIRNESLEELANEVVAQFRGPGWWHEDRIIRFFRDDFEPAWNLDVFAEDFDYDKGWHTYSHMGFEFLLMRFESLDAGVLSAFLRGSHDDESEGRLELPQRQVSEDKYYAALQRKVRERLDLSSTYLDSAYGSNEVGHFYRPDEIARFRARWERDR